MKLTSQRTTILLAVLFVLAYTGLVSYLYPHTLRLMEANCWVHDYVLQFFRWPVVGALLMSLPMCGAMLSTAFLLKLCKQQRLMPVSLLVALTLAYCYPPSPVYDWGEGHLFSEDMQADERVFTYQYLAEEEQWDELMRTLRQNGMVASTIGMRYMLLAESAKGTLVHNLFSYPINETEQFLFRGFNSSVSTTFNRLFYHNIAIWDECFHQAQEYAMCQRDFCLKSVCQMVDYSIKESEWRVAEKLLCVLDQALFYHDFVSDRRQQIVEGKKLKPGNDAPLRQDNFVIGYSLQNEMAHDLQYKIGEEEKIQDYVLCCMLIRKNLAQFCKSLTLFPRYRKPVEELPLPFQQAIQIYQSGGQALHDAQPGTYAYYLYNTEIPEQESRFELATTN